MTKQLSQSIETDILVEYKRGLSMQQLGIKYGIARSTVKTALDRNDIITRSFLSSVRLASSKRGDNEVILSKGLEEIRSIERAWMNIAKVSKYGIATSDLLRIQCKSI